MTATDHFFDVHQIEDGRYGRIINTHRGEGAQERAERLATNLSMETGEDYAVVRDGLVSIFITRQAAGA